MTLWQNGTGTSPSKTGRTGPGIISGPSPNSRNAESWFRLLTVADVIHRRQIMLGTTSNWHLVLTDSEATWPPPGPRPADHRWNPGTAVPLRTSYEETQSIRTETLLQVWNRLHRAVRRGSGAFAHAWHLDATTWNPALFAELNSGRLCVHPRRWRANLLNWLRHHTGLPVAFPGGTRSQRVVCCDTCHRLSITAMPGAPCESCASPDTREIRIRFAGWFVFAAAVLSALGMGRPGTSRAFRPASTWLTTGAWLFPYVPACMLVGLGFSDEILCRDIRLEPAERNTIGALSTTWKRLASAESGGTVSRRDILRWSLICQPDRATTPPWGADRLAAAAAFIQKVRNVARFVDRYATGDGRRLPDPRNMAITDKWFLHTLNTAVVELTENMEQMRLLESGRLLDRICRLDLGRWYLEFIKLDRTRPASLKVLTYSLRKILELLHPMIPFVSEEIAASLGRTQPGSLLKTAMPRFRGNLVFIPEYTAVERMRELITEIRRIRAHNRIRPGRLLSLYLRPLNRATIKEASSLMKYVNALAGIRQSEVSTKAIPRIPGFRGRTASWDILLPLKDTAEQRRELERLAGEHQRANEQIRHLEKRLMDGRFLKQATAEDIQYMKKRLQAAIAHRRRVDHTIKGLS